ncbi:MULTISPECIES: class I SAM-dependent methyltransferase [unclassified Janthinobacterium]|uniref:class I SAM-dependent methyltransferase n=1 Tax=unclassified Janthinobacterium TaxID=2610881 RepID=UPI0008809B33|nr:MULTISPECIES: class I SAM-dependent methyltransferase [unclassified Janthinobacterium]SDA83507.1 Methyltransferase domain-containing protein [Janthinobacterium sp. 551a]SFB09364.1 Methyltransferase domain-containing protein [Janthinobacterium sp. 344]
MQQHDVVTEQFGKTANAYLSSAVHAQGADLVLMQEGARRHGKPVVLDLGCGAGHASFAVAPVAASVIAYDLAQPMLDVVDHAKAQRGLHNIRTQQGDVARLPFADASFDMVVTRFSAHHWNDVAAALAEAWRVLRPNGTLLVVDIVAPKTALYDSTLQAVEMLRDASHVRDYRTCEWGAKFDNAGFAHSLRSVWKLTMRFDEWVARMRTPSERVAAIRHLFDGAPEEARRYFALQDDYSFSIDAAMFEATKPQVQ